MQIEGAEIKWSLFVRARAIDTPALRPWGRGGAWAGRGKRLGLVGPAQPPAACAPAARAMLAGWSGARHTSPARSSVCGLGRASRPLSNCSSSLCVTFSVVRCNDHRYVRAAAGAALQQDHCKSLLSYFVTSNTLTGHNSCCTQRCLCIQPVMFSLQIKNKLLLRNLIQTLSLLYIETFQNLTLWCLLNFYITADSMSLERWIHRQQ